MIKLKRKPDFIIGGKESPYLLRWWIIPRNKYFNIYLHKFLRDDDDRALHDHPYHSCSIILKGGYIEVVPAGKAGERAGVKSKIRKPGMIVFRRATQAHRVRLFRKPMWYTSRNMEQVIPAWSLFITGPRVRDWGFWCEGVRWIHWERFTSPAFVKPLTDKNETLFAIGETEDGQKFKQFFTTQKPE